MKSPNSVGGQTLRSRTGQSLCVRGFSLIELLVVIAIMALLATVGMPLAELSQKRTKENELRHALRDIRGALDAYKRMADEGRIERPADGSGYPPSLDVLVTGVKDARSSQDAKLYLLRRIPRDPFASPDVPNDADSWALRSYESSPEEPKPGKDVYDVHSRSLEQGLNGVAYSAW